MSIAILGVFVADTAYRGARMPRMGETVLGQSFVLGPGGKGSNQAVAAARAANGTFPVTMMTRLGDDDFADLAEATWKEAGVTPAVTRDASSYTGAAFIFIDDATGDNAIIIAPGAAGDIAVADIEANRATIADASVFMTQLEQPIEAAQAALAIAREADTTTILNPAPAAELSDDLLALCDHATPNETEAEALTGLSVGSEDEARTAADALLSRGVGHAVITLGERGALVHGPGVSQVVPAFDCGPVVETTGAGDAFNGGFAVALAEGRSVIEAARFGCATASLSVTRPGTAPSMPTRAEIEAVLGTS